MAIGTALLIIFGIWLLITYPRPVFIMVLALVVLGGVLAAYMHVSDERERPRLERAATERLIQQRAQQRATEARIGAEEATLLRDRATYRSADRWIGVVVDSHHCRYKADLETMTVIGTGIDVWIKVDAPVLEPGTYLSPNCFANSSPFRVFFSCVTREIYGGWTFTPGTVSEEVLRWIQASPWCAPIIAAANG